MKKKDGTTSIGHGSDWPLLSAALNSQQACGEGHICLQSNDCQHVELSKIHSLLPKAQQLRLWCQNFMLKFNQKQRFVLTIQGFRLTFSTFALTLEGFAYPLEGFLFTLEGFAYPFARFCLPVGRFSLLFARFCLPVGRFCLPVRL